MKLRRIMIAAPKSGSGKTTMACALLAALKNRGQQVISYKCGPDYIDPMFHKTIIGVPSRNLDTFFTGEKETKSLLLKDRTGEDFAVMEGVMGLFDGLGGIREEGSSYHLAKVTRTPIILVADAKGMGRSIIPLIAGFLSYDKEKLIQGIIFNRMSKSYYEILKPLAEEELDIKVLGYFPEYKEFSMESRYLGLKMPDEIENSKEQLQKLSKEMEKTVSIEDILQIAESADQSEDDYWGKEKQPEAIDNQTRVLKWMDNQRKDRAGEIDHSFLDSPVIAVAKDEAFCFYYEENLQLLREFGARIEYFSPLHDRKLPDGCSGILLGGGYPELHGAKLGENRLMLERIREAVEGGMPTVAECGGFMYLHSAIWDREGNRYAMADVIPGECYDTGRLLRFGYIEVEEKQSYFLPEGEKIRGHEFHYFESTCNGKDCLATKPVTGRSYSCMIEGENHWFGFPHLYYPSNPAFAKSFVEKAWKRRKEIAR